MKPGLFRDNLYTTPQDPSQKEGSSRADLKYLSGKFTLDRQAVSRYTSVGRSGALSSLKIADVEKLYRAVNTEAEDLVSRIWNEDFIRYLLDQVALKPVPELEPSETQPQSPSLTLDELMTTQRRGALARAAPDEPRGSRVTAASRRITPDVAPIDLYKQTLLSSDDEEVQAAAAGVLGEYGGASEVRVLGDVLVPRAPRVRCAAAAALANIGGFAAEQYLLRAIESDSPVKVREHALMALADLVTRGWETYQMSPQRMKMPEDLRRRLEALRGDRDLGPTIASILRAFD